MCLPFLRLGPPQRFAGLAQLLSLPQHFFQRGAGSLLDLAGFRASDVGFFQGHQRSVELAAPLVDLSLHLLLAGARLLPGLGGPPQRAALGLGPGLLLCAGDPAGNRFRRSLVSPSDPPFIRCATLTLQWCSRPSSCLARCRFATMDQMMVMQLMKPQATIGHLGCLDRRRNPLAHAASPCHSNTAAHTIGHGVHAQYEPMDQASPFDPYWQNLTRSAYNQPVARRKARRRITRCELD